MVTCTLPNKCHAWEPWSILEKGDIINNVSSTVVCRGGVIGKYIVQRRMCLDCRFIEENVQKWGMDRDYKMVKDL